MKEATKKVIIELKEVKKQRKLSCSDIVELVENNNDTISPSTVRRMFAKGSEDGPDFRPYSINSVVRALVGKDKIELTDAEEASLTEAEKEIITENSALRAAFDLNEAMIEDLRKQIELLTAENNSLHRTIDDMQIRLDTTTNIIALAAESFGKGSLHC